MGTFQDFGNGQGYLADFQGHGEFVHCELSGGGFDGHNHYHFDIANALQDFHDHGTQEHGWGHEHGHDDHDGNDHHHDAGYDDFDHGSDHDDFDFD